MFFQDFSRFLKLAIIPTSNFMNEVYNGGFAPEPSISMFKTNHHTSRDYVHETRK